jgi:hypothetical protein
MDSTINSESWFDIHDKLAEKQRNIQWPVIEARVYGKQKGDDMVDDKI